MPNDERRGGGRGRATGGAGRARLSAAAALLCVCLVPAGLAARGPLAGGEAARGFVGFVSVAAAARAQGGGAQVFSHSTPQHARQSCDSCHRRSDNSPAPRLPGHKACSDCHLQQFMTAGTPFCAGCHTSLEGRNPPVKNFPALRSFGVRFDHAQHDTGAGRPEAGCASCHAPARRGVALSIPAGMGAHANCYQCHTPQARGNLGSCATCHAPGSHRPTPTGARAFRVGFSHATHGPRQGMSCAECHTVRAGLPQSRQVSSPSPTQHFGSGRAQSCMTCHNNRRAFGGDDFADCKRCHKGQTFRF